MLGFACCVVSVAPRSPLPWVLSLKAGPPVADSSLLNGPPEAACAGLLEDFKPLSDPRASAWYRITTAQALLRKFDARVGPRALLEVAP